MGELREIIARRAEELAGKILDMQLGRQPDLEQRYGQTGMEMCRQDIRYHLFYLTEALSLDSPALFEDYMSWVKSLLKNLGLPEEDMLANLQCMKEVLRRELPAEYAEPAARLLDEAHGNYASYADKTLESLLVGGRLAPLARSYLDALLEGRRHEASRMIMEAVEQGTAVRDIYLQVFQPVQRELGRLWQLNRISVAQEHYCTAATQLIMSQLYPYIFGAARSGRRIIAACAPEELHEIGLRMVCDLLEMGGWDTYYLGANVPRSSVLRTVEDLEPHVLALSATIAYHVGEIADIIAALRANSRDNAPKIVVGGHPFNVDRDLWRKVNADGWAPDAEAAEALLAELAGGGG